MELKAGHLEVLSILHRAKNPIVYHNLFAPDLNPVLDLFEWRLISKEVRPNPDMPQDTQNFYQLTDEGRRYFEMVLRYASYINKPYIKSESE